MLLFPNAKINLGLYVTDKRADGFHNLETIFYPVGVQDSLEIVSDEKASLSVYNQAWQGGTEDNIVWKAYQLLNAHYPEKVKAVSIHLIKAIPNGAGLGGGSSDAAFTLKALNDFFQLKMDEEKLLHFALQLGSDCPFFILNKPCLAKGRGEILQAIDLSLDDYQVVLIDSGIPISTKDAFHQIQLMKLKVAWQEIINTPVHLWKNILENAFEKTVFPMYPSLEKTKEALYASGAVYAAMSGSGSVVFGLFEKDKNSSLQQQDIFEIQLIQQIENNFRSAQIIQQKKATLKSVAFKNCSLLTIVST